MLTKELIVTEALNLVRKEGINKLSMRKLGESLGVKAMSLYNHVQNREEIVLLLLDLVISAIEIPDPNGNWYVEMKKRSQSAHSVLQKDIWAVIPLMSRINNGSNMLRYLDRSLACLLNAGFSYSESDHIINYLDSFIYGFLMIESNFPIVEDEYSKATQEQIHLLDPEELPALYALSAELLSGRYDGKQDFETGLDFILQGIARRRDTQ